MYVSTYSKPYIVTVLINTITIIIYHPNYYVCEKEIFVSTNKKSILIYTSLSH